MQFIAIGGAIFLLAPRPPDLRRIEISSADLATVSAAQARRDDLPAGPLDRSALPHAGEPFPLPRETRATHDELRRVYGAAFAEAVAAQAPSAGYSEPVPSSFGWHRVRVIDVAPAAIPPFEDVERQVAFDLILQRREQTVRRFLDQTAARYEIFVDGARVVDFKPALRLARHETESGED